MGTEDLLRNINKIKSLHAAHGSRIVLKKICHLVLTKLTGSTQQKTLTKRKRLFSKVNKETLRKDLERIFTKGLLRPLDDIKADVHFLPSEYAAEIIAEADRIVENHFVLYGSLKVKIDKEWGWRRDPLTDYLWPDMISAANILSRKPEGTDIKNIWEIARFQFLCPLAYAYILTEDKKYPLFAFDKVNSWIKKNEFPYGPHWTQAMEPAIRLTNWCVYLPLLDILNIEDVSFPIKLANSILEHLIFINENLEKVPGHSNNHYLSNLVALILGPLIFPALAWGQQVGAFAEKEFEQEVQIQFKECGINFEGSIPYHRLSFEICLIGCAFIKKSGREISSKIYDRLRKATHFIKYYTDIGNDCPIIGDNDSGIFVKMFLGQEFNKHKYIKFLSECILDDQKETDGWDEYLCAVHFLKPFTPGFSCSEKRNAKPDMPVDVKEFDGLVIACHKSEALFFNTLQSYEGHVHNDKLAIYPIIGKELLFVDRGSFSYTGYPEKRHQDRSTVSHNCPILNNWEQNRIWKEDLFYLSKDADCGNKTNSSDHKITITGWHNGYARFSQNLKVFRNVEWDVEKQTMLISDWGEGKSTKHFHFTWLFIINPIWFAELKEDCILFTNETATIRFEDLTGVGFAIREGTYCPTYQQELPCQILAASYHGGLNEKINFLLSY